MLSEGFICGIPYWNENESENRMKRNEQKQQNTSENDMVQELTSVSNFRHFSHPDIPNGALSLFQRCKSIGRSFRSSAQGKVNAPSLQVSMVAPIARQKSLVVDIPRSSSVNKETYLVPSCCKSICDNYNDLQIAGDQVLPINSETSGLTSQSSYEANMVPFLYSSEIPPPMESPKLSAEFPNKPANSDTSCWRICSARDKSIIQHSQPLTNSMLNDYLEQKVLELYKQYIMDSMVSNASPTKIMESELVMSNVDQISMMISREQNMETTKAKDMVISCLLRLASEIQSNELSTPNLQISA
ncbi:TLR adapter interacting with SLC15A4 on the lysosome-like [Carcharodon carcharias]|uniref:TLR adapter interacting with SLC15A4 on the lysosome-like n=1 Tax=Carcharodon carcharias TaxID=13397 RepID=UPI001B7EBFDE|nr:TLR adapter interacting with SLC15A4 on the lysosome-like [Carcharodon carcharias]